MSDAPQLFEIPQGTKASRCRACGKEIYFVRSAAGRLMPLVPANVNGNLGPLMGTSHFADCPKADSFRKEKRP